MVKLVEGSTGDFRAGWMKPGKKSVENPPDRLLFPEKIYSKQSCQLVKKLCQLHRFEKGKRVSTSYICEHCNVTLCPAQCWEKYTKKVLW